MDNTYPLLLGIKKLFAGILLHFHFYENNTEWALSPIVEISRYFFLLQKVVMQNIVNNQ